MADSPPTSASNPEATPGSPPPPAPARAPAPVPPARAPGAFLALSLKARFALAGLVALGALVAMILFVSRNNTDVPPSSNPAAAVQANREAEILVAQDQAPRVVHMAQGLKPVAAITRVLRADMRRRIASGSLAGPLQHLRCRPTGPATGGRIAFSCDALAGNVTYPFLGVVDIARAHVTYCKRDPPPAPSDDVPVSRRCRA